MVKILVLADTESRAMYECFAPEKLNGIDLIIGCGDLGRSYLDFFATMSHVPVLFVPGNHDDWYRKGQEGGCICVEDDIYVYQGIRILGLGGSMRYHPGGFHQYTERQMQRRIWRLRWKLWRRGGFDILVTHAPARGINDLEDLPHRGFSCFLDLIQKYQPGLFIHGHIHASYGTGFKRTDQIGATRVVNGYDHVIIDYPQKL